MSLYDYIIVGGGMAGLHISKLLAEKFPDASICVVEKYPKFGGRVDTVRIRDDPKIHFESGAGRVARWHKHVIAYIQEFGLTTTPLHPHNFHRRVEKDGSITIGKNDFGEIAAAMIAGLPKKDLTDTVLLKECEDVYGKEFTDRIFSEFGYRSEVEVMRADLAANFLKGGGFQGEHSDYFIVNEGLSEIPTRLATKILEMGVRLITDVTVTGATRDGVWTVKGVCKEKPWSLEAKNVIWALHRNALAKIPLYHDAWFIKGVKMEPLYRIYARFPLDGGKPWFHDTGHVTTNDPLRYIIPYNLAAGLIMISYTDAQDTDFWHNIKDDEDRKKEIMKHIRALFPEKDIPEPYYWSFQYWADGCSYWLPVSKGGPIDAHKAQHTVHYPFPKEMPHMYVCGESWSCCQAWMEGALRSAEGLFEEHFDKK